MISAVVHAAEINSPEKIKQVAESSYWKRLLHYRQGWIWGETSEADGRDFFISPEGRDNPEAELRADIEAFRDPNSLPVGPAKQHAQCAFPERYRFLKSQLQLDLTDQPCSMFKEWKQRFHAQSVTLVYAAAYFGSPSSMFGHTFLRIDSAPRAGQTQKNDMLDYGISFDAVMGESGKFAYPIKGLLGMFPGMYSQMPYFMKTNSYNNMESRDLWEYQLNLTPEQVDRLLSHVWEMDTTYFNYYFINRNCSYQLLTLFEVANPEWNMTRQFRFHTIPVDTIRAVKSQPSAIRSVHFRPSVMHILDSQLMKLSPSELDRFHLVKNDVSLVNSSDTARTLDALMDWQRYMAIKNSVSTDEAEKKIDLRLLQMRAKLDDTPARTDQIQSEMQLTQPELGHPSSRLALGSASENNVNAVSLEARVGFHDLLNPEQGFLPNSALNVVRIRGSYLTDGSGTARLDELLLGEVISYQPFTRLKNYLSWQVSGGLLRPVDIGCSSCVSEYVNGGVGLTLGKAGTSVSLMATGHGELSNSFSPIFAQNYRAGPGALAVGLLKINDQIKMLASYEHVRYFPGPDVHFLSKTELAISYNFMPLDLRLQWDSYWTPWQYTTAITATTEYLF